MKKLTTIILVLMAMFAAAFSIFWFYEANMAKRNLKLWIESLKAKDTYITYDSMKTQGFPYQVDLVLVNPKIEVIDGVQKTSTVQYSSDRFAVSHVLFSHDINVFLGPKTVLFVKSTSQDFHVTTESKFDSKATLKLNKRFSYIDSTRSINDFVYNIDKVILDSKDLTVKDAIKNTVTSRYDISNLEISRTFKEPNSLVIDFKYHSSGEDMDHIFKGKFVDDVQFAVTLEGKDNKLNWNKIDIKEITAVNLVLDKFLHVSDSFSYDFRGHSNYKKGSIPSAELNVRIEKIPGFITFLDNINNYHKDESNKDLLAKVSEMHTKLVKVLLLADGSDAAKVAASQIDQNQGDIANVAFPSSLQFKASFSLAGVQIGALSLKEAIEIFAEIKPQEQPAEIK